MAAVADFTSFAQEEWQSLWETTVTYNLADSAVRCLTVGELLVSEDFEALRSLELYYPQINGSLLLRERIAALYEGATPEQVLVTVGAAVANQIVCQTLLRPGDHVVVIEPGYRQVRGLAENLGCNVDVVELDEACGWRLDIDRLKGTLRPDTRLLYVVNPNNPTGTILTAEEMSAIVHLVELSATWLLADEVYQGSERVGAETGSFFGRCERVVTVNSLSKTYGLCGLRIGWLVAKREVVEDIWRRHEYAVISAAGPSVLMAERALEFERRQKLIERQRQFVRSGSERLEAWVAEHSHLVSVAPLTATALALVRYHADLPSYEVANAIREHESVLVLPGEVMGASRHLRITHGLEPHYLAPALARIASVLETMTAKAH